MSEIDNRLLVGLESAMSSHMRNMIITVGAGLTIFNIQSSNKSIEHNILPLIFICVGVSMGCYAIYTYKKDTDAVKQNTFTYHTDIWNYYVALCIIQILTAIGFGYFIFTKVLS